MLEFKIIENLKPNKDLTNILKYFKYKVILGQIKTILHTNLQVIIPTEYKIIYPNTGSIINSVSNFTHQHYLTLNQINPLFLFFEYGNKIYI